MPVDLTRIWYRQFHFITVFLLPFSMLFAACTALRRWMFRVGIKKIKRVSVPVIVVGNITTGGTGKTPFVIWLAHYLQSQGYHPGIVSRGVGGKKHRLPHIVKLTDSTDHVGDEAMLLAEHTQCPLVICADRVAATRHLLQHFHCNIVISDDGLQHYRLGRDIEIAMVDGARRFGNHYLLPAGPLREPISRLQKVNFVIINGGHAPDELTMTLQATALISVQDKQKTFTLSQFPHKKVHAVAGIGHPEQFFQMLKQQGFDVIEHIFPDHYTYRAKNLHFNDSLPIFMTEKDAVKCRSFADQRYWYLSVTAKMSDGFEQKLWAQLTSIVKSSEGHHEVEEDFTSGPCHINRCVKHDAIRQ